MAETLPDDEMKIEGINFLTEPVDEDGELMFEVDSKGRYFWMKREEAIELIDYLKEVFNINEV
ncbi:MAG: hypothetical protein WC069_07000 [Candidatus Shapirobacteria bacterium]